MSSLNKHTPERFPTESQVDYRARQRASKDAQVVRRRVAVRNPVTKAMEWSDEIVSPSKNGGHRGTGMANIRAARKARNVRRHRAASRG